MVAFPKLRRLRWDSHISLILVSTAFQMFLLKFLRRNRSRHKWDMRNILEKKSKLRMWWKKQNLSLLSCCNLYQDSIIGILYCSVVALSNLRRLSCDSHVFLILVSTVSQMFLLKILREIKIDNWDMSKFWKKGIQNDNGRETCEKHGRSLYCLVVISCKTSL